MDAQTGAVDQQHQQQHLPYGQPVVPHSYAQTAQAALSSTPQIEPSLNDAPVHPNGNSRKRKSGQPGSRGVANLTPEQLAKKRANDREAQRAIRERTKNTIESLEQRIRELENQQPYQDLQRALQDRDRALEECESLRQRLAAVAGIVGSRDLGQTGLNELAALTAQQSPLPSSGSQIGQPAPYPPSTAAGYVQAANPLLHPDLRSPSNHVVSPAQTAPMFAGSDGAPRRWSPSSEHQSQYPSHGPGYEHQDIPHNQTTANEERHDLNFVLDQGQHVRTASVPLSNYQRLSPAVLAEHLTNQQTLTCPLDKLLSDFVKQQRRALTGGAPRDQIIGPDDPSFACLTGPEAARGIANDPISSVMIDIVSKFPDIAALPERAGTLWGMYHITRWLICPCERCFSRVPEFSRPLPESLETKHALWHDYVPWPSVRRQLMRTPESRPVRFDDFFVPFCQGLCVNWPYPESTCMITTPRTDSSPLQVKLHPNFEAHVSHIENWSVGHEFASTFPELVEEGVRIIDHANLRKTEY